MNVAAEEFEKIAFCPANKSVSWTRTVAEDRVAPRQVFTRVEYLSHFRPLRPRQIS
jgi:hypothetical protein